MVRFSRPYGTRAIGSQFEPQDDVLGYIQTVPTARRDPAKTVTRPALRGLLLIYSYSPLAYAVHGSPKREYGENMQTNKKPLPLRGWVLLFVLVVTALLIGVLRPKLAF